MSDNFHQIFVRFKQSVFKIDASIMLASLEPLSNTTVISFLVSSDQFRFRCFLGVNSIEKRQKMSPQFFFIDDVAFM